MSTAQRRVLTAPLTAQLTRQAVNYLLAQASARADLPPVNPHMLRHSCGFALANQAYDLRLIQLDCASSGRWFCSRDSTLMASSVSLCKPR